MAWGESSDRMSASIPRVDRVSAVHGSRSTHVRNKKSYNGWIKATWRHLMRWSRGRVAHQRSINTCVNSRRYNGWDQSPRIKSQPLDRDQKGKIWSVFITLISGLNRGRPSRSDGHDLIETVHRGPFHRNRRSKWSDGYAQIYYK